MLYQNSIIDLWPCVITSLYTVHSIIPRPSHWPLFDCMLSVCKNGWGRNCPFYHMSVYLVGQRRGVVAHMSFVLNLEWYIVSFTHVWNSIAWDRNKKIRLQVCCLMGDPLLPLLTSFLSIFAYYKQPKIWMVGRPGNEATLFMHKTIICSMFLTTKTG